MKSWMNAGGTAAQPVDVNTLAVQIWDGELGSNDEPYTSFHVLAWTERDTVVGRSEQGEVYLRVVPTRLLPRHTSNQLSRASTTTPPELAERYIPRERVRRRRLRAAARRRGGRVHRASVPHPERAAHFHGLQRGAYAVVLALRVCALT